MKKYILAVYLIFSAMFLGYLIFPGPKFPNPPSDSVQSMEPADTETSLRRAYFTNLTRDQVINLYRSEFKVASLPTMILNYPPEDSQTLIHDQTKSTFLEELVYPFRESLYINGFEPKEAKDEIWYKGTHFRQKIIIKFVPNSLSLRLIIAIPTLFSIWIVGAETLSSIKSWRKK